MKKPMTVYAFRVAEEHREKIARNGGGDWLRALIKRAKEAQRLVSHNGNRKESK